MCRLGCCDAGTGGYDHCWLRHLPPRRIAKWATGHLTRRPQRLYTVHRQVQAGTEKKERDWEWHHWSWVDRAAGELWLKQMDAAAVCIPCAPYAMANFAEATRPVLYANGSAIPSESPRSTFFG